MIVFVLCIYIDLCSEILIWDSPTKCIACTNPVKNFHNCCSKHFDSEMHGRCRDWYKSPKICANIFSYACPYLYTWVTSWEYDSIVTSSTTCEDTLSYYNQCGWMGYVFEQKLRYKFRFRDSYCNVTYILYKNNLKLIKFFVKYLPILC